MAISHLGYISLLYVSILFIFYTCCEIQFFFSWSVCCCAAVISIFPPCNLKKPAWILCPCLMARVCRVWFLSLSQRWDLRNEKKNTDRCIIKIRDGSKAERRCIHYDELKRFLPFEFITNLPVQYLGFSFFQCEGFRYFSSLRNETTHFLIDGYKKIKWRHQPSVGAVNA